MGERLVKWSLNGSVLSIAKKLEDPKAVAKIEAEFDLAVVADKLFGVKWENLTDTGKQAMTYFAKQKLQDRGASDKGDPDGKITAAKKMYAIIAKGEWTGERVNASERAAEKKAFDAVKAVSKEVSLQGLIIKQAMSGLPGQEPFTEEDAAKLAEFMAIAAKGRK